MTGNTQPCDHCRYPLVVAKERDERDELGALGLAEGEWDQLSEAQQLHYLARVAKQAEGVKPEWKTPNEKLGDWSASNEKASQILDQSPAPSVPGTFEDLLRHFDARDAEDAKKRQNWIKDREAGIRKKYPTTSFEVPFASGLIWLHSDATFTREKALERLNFPSERGLERPVKALFEDSAATAWLQAWHAAEPQYSPLAIVNGRYVLRTKDDDPYPPYQVYPFAGDTKDNSFSSEARARGDSMEAEKENDEGEIDFPIATAAAMRSKPLVSPRLSPAQLLAQRVCNAWIAARRPDEVAGIFDRQAPGPARARRQIPNAEHIEDVFDIESDDFDMHEAKDALRSGISERAFAKRFGVSLRQSRQFRDAVADLLGWDIWPSRA